MKHTKKLSRIIHSSFSIIKETYLKTLKTLKFNVTEKPITLEFPSKTQLLSYYKDRLPSTLTPSILADSNALDTYLNNNIDISYMIQNSLYNKSVPPALLHDYPNIYNYKLEFSEFLSVQIHNCIKHNITKEYTVDYGIGSLQIYTNKKGIKYDVIRKIVARILFFNIYLNTTKTPIFRIYACPMKKLLPKKNCIFTPNNINTAVTDGHTILIYRSEELIKSIGHECIHFHGLDYRDNVSHILDTSSYSVENKNGQILFFEATTELLANLLNTIITSIENKKNIDECINIERNFALEQKCKILLHCGCNTWNDFLKGNGVAKLVESTSVLAYFILKKQLLWNLEKVLKIIEFPNMKIDKLKAEKLALYLENMKTGDAEYINAVNNELKRQTSLKSRNLSLRMTTLE
jgi:hypothetical protein